MYSEPFYIDTPEWNNAFSFDIRQNKKLFVPSLKKIKRFWEIELWNEVVFEDYGFDDKLSTNTWLKNFYEMDYQGKPLFLFDNHNHAYAFWYWARNRGVIWDNNTLIHIDEHADTRDNNKHLLKPESYDLEKVFHFTNYVLNVGDYIIPAQEEGIIWDIVQIRNESNLIDYLNGMFSVWENIILNLDLDFFQPDLDFIDYELKKKVVLDVASKAWTITVATSPFFIDQELALKTFRDLFS